MMTLRQQQEVLELIEKHGATLARLEEAIEELKKQIKKPATPKPTIRKRKQP